MTDLGLGGPLVTVEAVTDVPKFGPTVSHLYHGDQLKTTHIPSNDGGLPRVSQGYAGAGFASGGIVLLFCPASGARIAL